MAPLSWQRLLLALVSALLVPSVPARAATDGFDDTDYLKMMDERDRGVGWNISPALSGGMTQPLDGYIDYQTSLNGSLDLYVRPPVPHFPVWRHKLMFRLSGEYFPLEVAEEVAGTVNDLYAVTGTVLYRFMSMDGGLPEHRRWVPFLGVGAGVFLDRMTVDHPAFGKVSSKETYVGGTASAGLLLPNLGPLRIIPEVRYYAFKRANDVWASQLTYQLGLAYWLPAKREE